MNRVLRSVAALAVLSAAATLTTTTSASAAACTDTICVYEGAWGAGTVAGFTTADNNFSNNRFLDGSAVNDRISSISMTGGGQALFYTDSFWRGNAARINGNGRVQSAAWDNAFSSFRFVAFGD
ncbi:peptidase inhibitor family I36 protein [Nonomuraea sp. B12E4]|uniref:peptidase inhibitor family I36 protein n=1 Tax=Nonomuraea sp. B12E4 TaxID=3153564 RepID=UPI00325D478C